MPHTTIQLPLIAALLTGLLLMAERTQAAPLIAEFQASNDSTVKDENGDNSDWIEIHNPDPAPADLAGMRLTDDVLLPAKWVLPAVTLPPGRSLLVWASGKNRSNPAAPLHTNFSLAAGGEYLALIAADGVTKLSEFNPFPAQVADRTYGSSRAGAVQTLISTSTPCRWLVPLAETPNWRAPDFNDTAWQAATGGIGYDKQTAGADFLPFIGAGGNVQSAMQGSATSVYVRIPFTITSAEQVMRLRLRMRYDDGVALYLNGVRLSTPTAEDTLSPEEPRYDSVALERRADAKALLAEEHDLTSQRGLLVDGVNLLAVQVLNSGTYGTDLLFQPELEATLLPAPEAAVATGFFAQPTPGEFAAAAPVAGFVAAPVSSRPRGFLSAPTTLTLSSSTAGAAIRYTTDGTPPTETDGTLYTGSVEISSTTILRSVAYRAGWQVSAVSSHSYIFPQQVISQPAAPAGMPTTWGWSYDEGTELFNTAQPTAADYRMDTAISEGETYGPEMLSALQSTLPVISMALPMDQLFGINGIYSNGRFDRAEFASSMEYFDPATGQTFQENAGMRIHGGNAPNEHPKKPFRLYFRRSYGGTGELNQPLFPGSPVAKFDKLQLRPGGHDGWSVPFGSGNDKLAAHATYLRDRFLRQTELDMGRLSSRGSYVHLYLNGLYWGIYDLHEVPSSEFYSDHKGGNKAEWDAVEHSNTYQPPFDVVDGEGARFQTALNLCQPPEALESDSVYDQVRQIINVDDFIDHLIVQMWAANNDWTGPVFRGVGTSQNASRFSNKNWQAGMRSRGNVPGAAIWTVWDGEICMGSSLTSLVSQQRVLDFDLTRIGLPTHLSGVSLLPGPPGQLYHALRQNARFRTRFADRLQLHLSTGGVLSPAACLTRITVLQNQLHSPLAAESARWGDVNSGNPTVVTFTRDDHWLSEVNWLKNTYIPQRGGILLSQFSFIGLWPGTQAPLLSPAGGSIPAGDTFTLTHSESGTTLYYTLDGTDPLQDASTQSATFLTPTAIGRFKVPSSTYPDEHWKNPTPPADIATWGTGHGGFGFGTQESGYTPYIGSSLAPMHGNTATAYLRLPFNITAEQLTGLTRLTARLRYDDGFRLYLNGQLVKEVFAPFDTPSHLDTATYLRPNDNVILPVVFDLSEHIPLLQAGENLLAVQVMNIDASDADLLFTAELTGLYDTPREPSTSALVYSGPVPVTTDMVVRARTRSAAGEWSPVISGTFTTTGSSGPSIGISELHYNPAITTGETAAGYTAQQFEYVELLNHSDAPVNLSGYRFTEGVTFTFPAGSPTLAPGQRTVVASDAAAFQYRHGFAPAGAFADGTNLSNGGERLALVDALNRTVFDFTYDDAAPWPTSPDGNGPSLVLIAPFTRPDPALPQNWRASLQAAGTPGSSEADTYSAWATRHGAAADPTHDNNANGMADLLDYVLVPAAGSFFTAQMETLTVGGIPGRYLTLRYRHNTLAEDVVLTPEHSDDLILWQPMAEVITPVTSHADGSQSHAWRSPLPEGPGNPRGFIRLRAQFRPSTP